MITERKLRVYRLLVDICSQAILTLVAAGVFIALTVAFIRNPSWILGSANTVFGVAILIVFRYYFPTRRR